LAQGSDDVRISISITDYSWPGGPAPLGPELAHLGELADAAGVDTLWVADHLVQADPTVPPDHTDMLEAYTVLGFLAGRTTRVRLGAMVSPVTMRLPSVLIKAVTSLDVVSGGRAWFGVGAGYHAAEAEAVGLPLPPVPERFELLEDTLLLARQMWAGDERPFTGHGISLGRPHGDPRPVRQPHPPVLIGGTGEQRTLRLVAEHADACNLFDIPDEGRTVRHKLDVLRRHCDAVGRDFDAIEKTLSSRFTPGSTAGDVERRCADVAALGIEHLVLITPEPWSTESLSTLATAIPAVRELGAA
jgi:alkanesulfonate monooxygenase SsuD/methylene tetrahydromethanopterin reductase-like flavin-dependent oxidoreductase (luciferase family)